LKLVEGDSVSEIAGNKAYTQDVINLLGQRLFTTMADQLFRFHTIHGDPHAGNFAFRPDGTLIMYDFGCVKELKPEIVDAYRKTLISSLNEDYEALDHYLIALGVRVADKPAVDEGYYAMWRDIFIQPFDSREHQYNFAEANLHKLVASKASSVFKYLDSFNPPVESLFIDRMIAGHYWLMKNLGVHAAFRVELEKYLDL